MEPSRREGRALVITGASTGIGAACATDLAGRGFRVFAGVRRAYDGERLKEQSPAITPLLLDVTDACQIAAAAETVHRSVGEAGLAGLVNNAGIVVAGPLEILPLDRLRLQLEVNVVGQIAVTQAFLPVGKARGRIVNMGSFNGRIAAPYLAPYAASKHALEALSDALRLELRAWGIRVSLIEPGGTTTPIWDKSLAATDAWADEANNQGMGLYRDDLAAMRQATRKLAEASLPVHSVVRCVVHALISKHPWSRYPVGLKVNLLFRARKWVPDRIWDWIIERSLGLPKVGPP